VAALSSPSICINIIEVSVSGEVMQSRDLNVGYSVVMLIGPILWGHSGRLCHALSLSLSSLSWTSMRRRRATVPVATSGELA